MAWVGYKWGMYKIFKRDPVLASALPETRLWSQTNLWNMLDLYGTVILKPSAGSRGSGIIQVTQKAKEHFEIHWLSQKRLVTGKKAAYAMLQKLTHPSYLIQQRIPLAEISERPMDIRVIVQRRNKNAPWTVTGCVAKVAGKGYIVTNVTRSQGSVLPVRQAIAKSTAKQVPTEKVIKHLMDCSLLATKRLSVYSPQCTVLGYDMGVDHRGKVWIIEVNGKPILSHFLKLKDKSMYRKIISYGYNPNSPKRSSELSPLI